jgi:hypothetical protein
MWAGLSSPANQEEKKATDEHGLHGEEEKPSTDCADYTDFNA